MVWTASPCSDLPVFNRGVLATGILAAVAVIVVTGRLARTLWISSTSVLSAVAAAAAAIGVWRTWYWEPVPVDSCYLTKGGTMVIAVGGSSVRVAVTGWTGVGRSFDGSAIGVAVASIAVGVASVSTTGRVPTINSPIN